MAHLQGLLEQVRAAVAEHGEEWLQAGLGSAAEERPGRSAARRVRERQRRSHPPERLSPEVTPRVRRRIRSPIRDPLPLAAGRSPSPAGRAGRRNPAARRGPAGAGGRVTSSPALRQRGGSRREAAASPGEVPVGEAARRGGAAGAAAVSALEEAGCRGSDPERLEATAVRAQASGTERRGLLTGGSRRLVSAVSGSGGVLAEEEQRAEDSPESSVEEGECELGSSPSLTPVQVSSRIFQPGTSSSGETAAATRGSAAAGSSSQGRPGEQTSSRGEGSGLVSQSQGEGPLQDFLGSLGRLLAGWGSSAGAGSGSPAAVWLGAGPSGVVGPVREEVPRTSTVVSGDGGAEKSGEGAEVGDKEGEKRSEVVRLADAAQGQMYVCFEGPLGVHLKQEVRDRIWRDEYVEIFSLLPLEKFNLDRVKPVDTKDKKEDEEKRRYRLIPRTFTNWLQAFAILASVIGEKTPEHCSALFCYMDSIGEAYRVYGGVAWLRYDEQFRQRKAVRPSLRWDHKDISLWMRLMAAPRMGTQPFQGKAGGSSVGGSSAGGRGGCCWQFNEGYCKFSADCRFKHECSGCGGAHSLSRCFKRGKGKGVDAAKRGDTGESGRDAAVSRDLSK